MCKPANAAPELEANGLLNDDRKRPCREQRVQQTTVQSAHHKALNGVAERTGHDEGNRDAQQKMKAEMGLAENGNVGADHDELAMRHIDDTHCAIGDGKPESDQQQNGRKTKSDKNYIGHTT